MRTLVIYCHPHEHSHNHKILQQVRSVLEQMKADYEVLDLYRMRFEPIMSKEEYDQAYISRSRRAPEDVAPLQHKIVEADHYIFIYPVWWYNMPAMLVGFIDRVFTAGFAYRFKKVPKWQMWVAGLVSFVPGLRYLFQPYSVVGSFRGKKATLFRTFGGEALGRRIFGNTTKVLEQVVLRFCGITDIVIHELWNTDRKEYSQAYEDLYMKRVSEMVKDRS